MGIIFPPTQLHAFVHVHALLYINIVMISVSYCQY